MSRHTFADRVELRSPRTCVRRTSSRDWHTSLRLRDGHAGLSHWLTLLCLALVFLSGTIQAEHVHPASPSSVDTHAACSLCVTAHVGVETASAPLLYVAASVIGQTEPRHVQATFPTPRNFDLFTRPPPTDPTLV